MGNGIWLPGWRTLSTKDQGAARVATAEYIVTPSHCRKCGVQERLYAHGTKTVEYRDTPAWGRQFIIRAIVKRFRCRECLDTFMQPLPDIDTKRHMTKRCVEYIEQQGVAATYAELARAIGVDEKTIRNICNERFERDMAERRIETPRILGIDELTLMGRKRTIFVDIGGKKLLDLIDAMNRGKVERWLLRLPNRDHVQYVTIDMWGPYREATRALLPNAQVVIDKWHVVSKANQALDRVRNRVRREAGIRKNPQKGRRLLQTSRHHLSPMRRMMVEGILANNPVLDVAWHAKEIFYDIWDMRPRSEAEAAFNRWAATIPPVLEAEFRPVAQMVNNWREEIFAYFDCPITNAYTEARNGLVKITNRAGRGYSFDTIRAKALLADIYRHGPTGKCPGCKAVTPLAHMVEVDVIGNAMSLCKSCANIFNTGAREYLDGAKHHLSTPRSG